MPPAVVVVEGEAGVGKSRLVREIPSLLEGQNRRMLLGHCHRLHEPFLLGPVVEALRDAGREPPTGAVGSLVGALRPLLPELAGVLPPEPAPLWDPRAERHRVFRALREFLEAFGPTVCVLEDLHWADEGTLEFLAFLLSRPPPELALVLTYRTEEPPAASPVRSMRSCIRPDTAQLTIELSPLTGAEVTRLICAILDTDAVAEEFAREVHQRTAGVPFAVEEVLRLLRDQGQLLMDEGQPVQVSGQIGVPPAIAQSIQERMRGLDRDARLITHSAAVLAVAAEDDLLTSVAGLSRGRAMSGLTEALMLGLLEEKRDGCFGFRHALAAEAVHATIPAPARRRLHLRAARALESGPEPRPLGRLAHHFRESKHGRWIHYAEEAADAATSAGNDREAARLLEEALGAPRLPPTTRIRMATKLGTAALYSMSPQGAGVVLQRVLDEESMGAGLRGELRLSLSRLQAHAGDSSWREQMIRAVGELQRRPELAAPAMAALAWPTTLEGTVDEDLGWLRRAVEAAARTEDPMVKSFVSLQRAAILLLVGDPEGWRAVDDLPEDPRSLEQKVQLLRGYHNLSIASLGLGHHRHAERFLAEVRRLNDELEHVDWDPWLESTTIGVDWRLGRWEGLESRARELMRSTLARPALVFGHPTDSRQAPARSRPSRGRRADLRSGARDGRTEALDVDASGGGNVAGSDSLGTR
ncbi:MAG: AAA family ATPase [Actinomycetota bacterium]|nr:AAA family ATPase [Actinomycetota bacterium]